MIRLLISVFPLAVSPLFKVIYILRCRNLVNKGDRGEDRREGIGAFFYLNTMD
jgi:hypothetical protein